MQHLLNFNALSINDIYPLFDLAEEFLQSHILAPSVSTSLEGHIVANLFFEPSTRTRNSFEIAASRLGAIVISPDMSQSALQKGETLLDTFHNLEAMGVSAFVVRHKDNNFSSITAGKLHSKASIINAGDGTNQHPTQALLDLFTIKQAKPDFHKLSIAIVGDILHSRVANSLIDGLNLLGVPDIRLVAPAELLPTTVPPYSSVSTDNKLSTGIRNVDVVICLRLQKERMNNISIDCHQFAQSFCVTDAALAQAKPSAIIMHPGPMNRDIEISSSVADGCKSLILQQVKNGVAMRMAIFRTILLLK